MHEGAATTQRNKNTRALPSEDTPTHDQCTTIRRYTYTIPTGAAATPRLASTPSSEDVPTLDLEGQQLHSALTADYHHEIHLHNA